MGETLKKTRWQSCNVLNIGPDAREIWAFASSRGGFVAAGQQTIPGKAPLPLNQVGKDWKTLFQPKLNIALLPPEQVFMRVLHLPASSFDELLSMVELQLEKVSPLPVPQVVWSVYLAGKPVDNLQTVVVIIVERDLVQRFVGQLEKDGYLADRLEVPFIDQLQATRIDSDGAWIYPANASGKFSAVVAWWYGGVLRNLGLLHVPAVPERAALLEEQLRQMSWAGEIEGWLTSPPQWHLVADEATAAAWQPMFEAWLGHRLEPIAPLSHNQLATLTANRSAQAEPRASLLPLDYSTRYRQEFIDRLWIRGLGTVVGAYVLCVLLYLAAASVQEYRAGNVEYDVKRTSATYTNTLQLKAKVGILQDRQALKFASLDCWRTVAELLPEGLTLGGFDFKGGQKLTLNGTAPVEGGAKLVADFNDQIRKALVDGQLLFSKVEISRNQIQPGGSAIAWAFSADLARGEEGGVQ